MPKKDLIRLPVKGRRPLSFAVSDLPDGTRKYVFDQTDPSLTLGQFDARKIKGDDLIYPTIAATLPMSVENPAIAYDPTNDEFYVRSRSTTRPIYADLRFLGGNLISKTNPLNVRLADGTDNIPFPTALDTGAFKTREQNPITSLDVDNWPTVLQTSTSIGTLADVTAAASATQLTANSTPCKTVTVKALAGNTGKVRVGDSNVTASRGHELSKDQAIDIVVNNVNLIYVFGNASDKVSVIYVN